jgi:DNA-binding NtrC family response regulator
MARASLLVVDDEPSVRKLLDSVLRRAGFEVHLAARAEEALELFQRTCPDAVLTDVVMPGMDGVQLLEALRRRDARVPVVLMTGFGAIDAAVDAMRRGASDYITKPFRRQQVVDAIERALAQAPAGKAAPETVGQGVEQSVLDLALERRMTLREVGDLYIERMLSLSRGNKVQAARALGINRRTLYRRGGATKETPG